MQLSGQEELIVHDLRKTGCDVSTVARRFGMNAEYIRQVAIKAGMSPSRAVDYQFGKESLRPFIVAVTPAGTAWDNLDPKIEKARKDYDDGKIEMMTGRDGDTMILYGFPKKVRQPREYFYASSVD